MLTLSLLRHAKSNRDDPLVEDFERPLAKRGAKAAPVVGAWLGSHELVPDVVLCSGAIRSRATLALLLPEFSAQPGRIVYDDDLYLAPAGDLLGAIRRIKDPARHVMVVGHNPGLHALALSLIRSGDKGDLAALAEGFPTCALAVFTFDTEEWSGIGHASGRLIHFVTPRQL